MAIDIPLLNKIAHRGYLQKAQGAAHINHHANILSLPMPLPCQFALRCP
jgi:hypothetical protein